MNSLTILQRFAQIFGLIFTASLPFWIDNFSREDSNYKYLMDLKYLLQFMIILLVLVFVPQIISLFRFFLHRSISIIFFVMHTVLIRRRLKAALLLIFILPVILGGVSLIQGLGVFGYSVYRQIKYSPEIARQLLVESANHLDVVEGPLMSSIRLQEIIDRYPHDERNASIRRRIKDVNAANLLADSIASEAALMKEKGLHAAALELFRVAKQIFPHNQKAQYGLKKYREQFAAQGEQIHAFYTICTEREPISIARVIPDLSLLFWKQKNIVLDLQSDDSKIVNRTIDKVCSATVGEISAQSFAKKIELSLFGNAV